MHQSLDGVTTKPLLALEAEAFVRRFVMKSPLIPIRRLGLAACLIGAMSMLQLSEASVATAGDPPIAALASADKNGAAETGTSHRQGSSVVAPPGPGSKNDESNLQALSARGITAADLAASGSLVTCGVSGNWQTTSSTFQIIHECTLSAPQDGWAFIFADGSVAGYGEYEAHFRIGVDSTGGDEHTDRFVNVYNDTWDGTDESVALSVRRGIGAGTHTFYFLGRRYDGTGTVKLGDATLTVIFVPATDSDLLSCGVSGYTSWTTTSSSFQTIHNCALSVPRDGWVFISANGSVGRYDGEYEAQFRIGVDSPSGDPDVDRYVNVYNDSGDGTDRSVALSVLRPVTAGAHTFYFLGRRYSGAGRVLVHDPTLTVLYIPSPSRSALACGVSGDIDWTTTSSTFQIIHYCTLSVPQDGWVFLSADGSVARHDDEYEAHFSIGIDDTGGDPYVDRYVNVYNDSGDGTDKSVALTALRQVTAGVHTFYFLGYRGVGPGTAYVYDPTLTVIVPGARVYLPLVMKLH
jgi:hypothetical protein